MHIKSLLTFSLLASLVFAPAVFAIKTDDLPPDGTWTKNFDPIHPKVASIFRSPIMTFPLGSEQAIFKNRADTLYKFIWASDPSPLPSLRVIDEGGKSYLRLTSKSDKQSWGVWMMPVPTDGSESFEVSADISFIPDKPVAGKPSGGEVSFMPTWYKTDWEFVPDDIRGYPEILESKISTTGEQALHVATGRTHTSSRGTMEKSLKYIGFCFTVKGYGVAEIRNITIKSYIAKWTPHPAARMTEVRRRQEIEKIGLEKDPVKKAALEKESLKNAVRVRVNKVKFAAKDAAKALNNKDLEGQFIRIAYQGITKAKAAIDANDLESAETIVEETIAAIKKNAAENNLFDVSAQQFEFDGFANVTLAEYAKKQKGDAVPDALKNEPLETDPIKKAALEQEALDAKAKAGEGDKQQSEAVQ